jgi:hypothetical protein
VDRQRATPDDLIVELLGSLAPEEEVGVDDYYVQYSRAC